MKKMLREIEELKIRVEFFELRARVIEARNRLREAQEIEAKSAKK